MNPLLNTDLQYGAFALAGAIVMILGLVVRGFLKELSASRNERVTMCTRHQELQVESVRVIQKLGDGMDRVRDGIGEMVNYLRAKNGDPR